MSDYDQVIDHVVAQVEASALATHLDEVTILRDLKGRVRLALAFHKDPVTGQDLLPPQAIWPAARAALDAALANQLNTYWGQQIWRMGDRKDAGFQALKLAITTERRPFTPSGARLRWYKLERLFSKAAWFRNAAPPWDIANDPAAPAIVSFYSYKGGVGRTLTVAAIALLLAQADRRVVVLDLDLEAPGVGALLLGSAPPPDDGIVDYLIEWQLRGRRPATLAGHVGLVSDPALVGSETIRVLSAGRINESYLEKIARLDFETTLSSGGQGLTELLRQIRDEYSPHFILLDVRSGLHDLGGLSLNGLCHLDVLFGRESEQAFDGLATVLALLGAAPNRQDALVVHAQVPKASLDPGAHERFRSRCYRLFQVHYYSASETMDDVGHLDAPYGLPIPFKDELQLQRELRDPEVLRALVDPSGAYHALAKLIGTYLARETVAP